MDFWSVHSIWFIVFMFLFPRLTMLFMGICFYPFAHPILFWIGWFIGPRYIVAILATSVYWDTNPVLCFMAWMAAFGVSSAETKKLKNHYSR